MPGGPSFARYPWWRRWFGTRSERAAAAFLRARGHRVLAANVADRAGELDLITVDGPALVIVEVRSTESADTARVAASVDHAKQRRVTEAALRYLKSRRLLGAVPVRFDVVLVSWPPGRREPRVEHYPHAFEAVGKWQMWS